MQYVVRNTADCREVEFSGRLTFKDHDTFSEITSSLKDTGVKNCVFDLSNVEFIDSAALGMMLLARETAVSEGVHLILRGAKGRVKDIMVVANFGVMFTIED